MLLELDERSFVQGVKGTLRLCDQNIEKYDQLQVEIFEVGVRNPSFCVQFDSQLESIANNWYQVVLDSSSLTSGKYEVRRIWLHAPKTEKLPDKLGFVSGQDFERVIFEVIPQDHEARSKEQVEAQAFEDERILERQFLEPLDIRTTTEHTTGYHYSVFVFVVQLLVGAKMRFDRFEILPTGSGLDTTNQLDFVNKFLNAMGLDLGFSYEENLRIESRQTNPVCVVHFPNILALDPEAARLYAEHTTNRLLVAMSLARDASGRIFDVVINEHGSRKPMRYTYTAHAPYPGNLLTGPLAGEDADTMEKYIRRVGEDQFMASVIGMYKDTRGESNVEFQYLRLWQILEVLAARQNYDQRKILFGTDGNPISENGKQKRVVGGVAIVFNLLREKLVNTSPDLWDNVNVWFAFRTAIVHHGSIFNYHYLSRANVREWARVGVEEVQRKGHDRLLWSFRLHVKIVLQKLMSE